MPGPLLVRRVVLCVLVVAGLHVAQLAAPVAGRAAPSPCHPDDRTCGAFLTVPDGDHARRGTMADESKAAPADAAPHAPKRPRTDTRRSVGVVGYGHLGQYLVAAMLDESNPAAAVLRVGWVWNRSPDALSSLPKEYRLASLDDFAAHPVDVIIEVAHPSITAKYGAAFVRHADFVSGSPTAFADAAVEATIRAAAAESNGHGVYIPSGAMWGAQDIKKMADLGKLGGLTITMKKQPQSLKVLGAVKERNDEVLRTRPEGEVVLYEGPVRGICPLAPNNVNTMAAGALAAHTLGFDGVVARLVADLSLTAHVITVDVTGKPRPSGEVFKVSTERYNPAATGAVTGSATYASFLASLMGASGQGDGVHFC